MVYCLSCPLRLDNVLLEDTEFASDLTRILRYRLSIFGNQHQ